MVSTDPSSSTGGEGGGLARGRIRSDLLVAGGLCYLFLGRQNLRNRDRARVVKPRPLSGLVIHEPPTDVRESGGICSAPRSNDVRVNMMIFKSGIIAPLAKVMRPVYMRSSQGGTEY